ncbi:hypothetical protein JAO78_016465 [Alishewanella sp. 16-MA]|uniref:Uncharacterized protein n=1 Tax=Alishewanella maricola TaxID=2795740 RepID=A0ABS8C7T4_9ALTE|nr:hypothetical protein [Alishewanella maricola]MCB5228399.1 hypothetical protein [Alishewanella maricola]
MVDQPKKFISETLLPDYPPKVPLLKANWSGLAFDRNVHSDLAPANVWDALLSFEDNSEVAVISFRDLEMDILPVFVQPDRESLLAYLGHDFCFTADHYVFSQEQNWICRLDQDVTLIAGETKLIQQLVNCCDGFESVMKIMSHDFDSGPNDECGLEKYLINLTRGLINRA